MTDFWRDLSDRERLLIAGGGVVAALLLVLQLLVFPVFSWRDGQQQRLSDAKGVYELVAEAAPYGGATTLANVDTQTPPRSAITQSASIAGVTLVFVNSRDDGGVDVNIAAVDPAMLYAWLGQLRDDYGISVDGADIARDSGDPTSVRAQLSFRAGARS